MKWSSALALLLLSGAQCARAADLKPATVEAFDRYIRQTYRQGWEVKGLS